MKKIKKISLWIISTIAVLVVAGYLYWTFFALKSIQLTDNITLVHTSVFGKQLGANMVFEVNSGDVFMVDDQLAPFAKSIRKEISKHGGENIKFIVNTHWHPDHSGGNAALGENATIIAHSNAQRRFKEPQKGFGLTAPDSYHEFPARPSDGWATETIDSIRVVQFHGQEIQIIPFANSHTDGDLVVYFKGEKVLCVGDLFWPDQLPYVDVYNKGNSIALSHSIDRLLDIVPDDVKIVTGHGPVSSKEDLIRYSKMIRETTNYVQDQMASNQSLEQIQNSALPEVFTNWQSKLVPANVWVKMVYESIKGE